MKIGIVGYQGCGKSTLFQWITGETPDPSLAHRTQMAMAEVPEPKLADLCDIYRPKKVTRAALEIVDTPGLSRSHEGSAARLAAIREAGCLVLVVGAFGGGDPWADAQSFEDDLLIADLDVVQGRVERLRDAVKRPRPNREEQEKELAALEPLLKQLEEGQRLHELELTPEQQRATRSFQLFAEKPRLLVINSADDETDQKRFLQKAPDGLPVFVASLRLEVELAAMSPEERDEFCQEMQVKPVDRDALIRAMMEASGQMLFFTAGEKEVRTWMIRRGGTALDAASGIHTDLAKGFIRAETMCVDDLIRLGGERELKAQNLVRKEHKDYQIQEGDVITVHHN